MSRTAGGSTRATSAAAAGFDRPLLLTAREDLVGYVTSLSGRALLFLTAASSVLAVFLIFIFITREAFLFFVQGETLGETARFFLDRAGEVFGSTQWHPEHEAQPEFGMLAIVAGSFYVTFGSVLIAVPLGLLTAICLSDIFPFTLRQIVKPVVELLAAIPSVAYGFFAVMVVKPWMQEHLGIPSGANVLNASIILAVMAVPTIVSVSEDALTAVGRPLREASYALGATRAETMIRVVIPAAHNGIIAAVILGMMRAVGETMVVWMAAGNATQIPTPWWDLTESVRTMTATIAQEMGETAHGSVHYHSLFTIGVILLVFTFVLNTVTEFLLSRMQFRGTKT
jgi:phosphate ABC transporter permease protein PstC